MLVPIARNVLRAPSFINVTVAECKMIIPNLEVKVLNYYLYYATH